MMAPTLNFEILTHLRTPFNAPYQNCADNGNTRIASKMTTTVGL